LDLPNFSDLFPADKLKEISWPNLTHIKTGINFEKEYLAALNKACPNLVQLPEHRFYDNAEEQQKATGVLEFLSEPTNFPKLLIFNTNFNKEVHSIRPILLTTEENISYIRQREKKKG